MRLFRLLPVPVLLASMLTVLAWGTTVTPQERRVLSVRDFGAKGDGRSDDYEAMKRAATALCAKPGSTLLYPPGTYKILQHRIKGGPRASAITDIVYDHCLHAKIIGDRARIDVTGSYHRSADYTLGHHRYSYTLGVSPFRIANSSDLTIQGFDINGNAQDTTRDPGVWPEGSAAGIRVGNSSHYTIADVHVHHFLTDGIFLGGRVGPGAVRADRDVTVNSVIADHNARNGMSLIQVRGITIVNSVFRDNGRTDGSYGGDAPASGIDVEPNAGPPRVDVDTGDVRILNSRFEDNRGFQLVSEVPDKVGRIEIDDCYVRAQAPDDGAIAFLVFPADGVVKNCRFDISSVHSRGTRDRAVFLHAPEAAKFRYLRHLVYEANTFDLDANGGVFSEARGGTLNIDFLNNTIRVRAANPDRSLLSLRGLSRVEGNRFDIGSTGFAGQVSQVVISYDQTRTIRGNTYSTNLTVPGQRFRIAYPKDGHVVDETYVGNVSP